MKKIKKETVFFQCESCNEEWVLREVITPCILCGKELCPSCAVELFEESLIDNFIFDELKIDEKTRAQELLCDDCHDEIFNAVYGKLKEETEEYIDAHRQRSI